MANRRRDNRPYTRKTSSQLKGNKAEWEHQVSLLKRRVKDFERKFGYKVDFSELEHYYNITNKPDRVTKSKLQKLQNIKRKQILRFAYDPSIPDEFWEPDSYTPEETPIDVSDVELANLRSYIESYERARRKDVLNYAKTLLLSALDTAISAKGKSYVAQTAEEYANAHDIATFIMQASSQPEVDYRFPRFAEILFGRAYTFAESQQLETMFESVLSHE